MVKQFLCKTGRRRHDLLTKVKNIAIYKNELSTVALVSDLERQVSRLESVNASIIRDNKLLELKYKETSVLVTQAQSKISKVTVDITKLKEESSNLYNIIEKLSAQREFENQGKTVLEVGKRQQDRKLKTLQTRIDQALWFSESFGLHLDTVKLVDDSGSTRTISFGNKSLKSYKNLPTEDKEKIQQVLYIMDTFCIGEASYHELTCCSGGEQLPRSYLVKQCKEDLNKLFYIEQTPGTANGASLDFEQELICVLEKMVRYSFCVSLNMQ